MKDKKNLFERAYQLAQEAIMNKEDTKELVGEFSYHKDDNPQGYDKKEVKNIVKAAHAKAKSENLKQKIEELEEIEEIQNRYS